MAVKPAPTVGRGLPLTSTRRDEEHLRLFVFGESGVGKTSLAGTAEDDERTSPVLLIDAEGGTLSISYREIDVVEIRDFVRDFGAVKNYFDTTPREQIPYKSIVLDSATEIAERCMRSIVGSGKPDYGDWNEYTIQMRGLIAYLKDLPYHLIVTALEEFDDGRYKPLFSGRALSRELPPKFDTVARLHTTTVTTPAGDSQQVRRLTLRSDTKFLAKDRMDKLGTLPAYVDGPTIGRLMDRMAEGRAQAIKARQRN